MNRDATYEHPDRSALIFNSVTDDDLAKIMMLHWFRRVFMHRRFTLFQQHSAARVDGHADAGPEHDPA